MVRMSHGMCCPKCGADTEVHIEATIPVKLLPHGEIDRVDDIEWQDTKSGVVRSLPVPWRGAGFSNRQMTRRVAYSHPRAKNAE